MDGYSAEQSLPEVEQLWWAVMRKTLLTIPSPEQGGARQAGIRQSWTDRLAGSAAAQANPAGVQAMVASDQRGAAPAYLADGADDLEADGAGLELRPLGFLVPLRVTPLRVDLLLPARHPSASASTAAALPAATGGFLPPAIGFGSPPALPAPRARESGIWMLLRLPRRTFLRNRVPLHSWAALHWLGRPLASP